MKYAEIRKHAEKVGATRFDIALWKYREKVPYHWQKKIVDVAKNKVRFDHFWEIDWEKDKENEKTKTDDPV